MSRTEVAGQMDLSCADRASLHHAGAPGGSCAGSQKGGSPSETLASSPAQPWPATISSTPPYNTPKADQALRAQASLLGSQQEGHAK